MTILGSPLGPQQRLTFEAKRSAALELAEPRDEVTPALRKATAIKRATLFAR
jgi:hypothetical protein